MNLQEHSVTGLIVRTYGLASGVTILPEHSGGGHLHGMYQAARLRPSGLRTAHRQAGYVAG